jgi:hypothetical protein
MTDWTSQVNDVIKAIGIRSFTSYSWFGKTSPILPLKIRKSMTAQNAREYLVYSLQNQLYRNFYCRGFPIAENNRENSLTSIYRNTSYIESLSSANSGRGTWDYGWEVDKVSDHKIILSRDGLQLWADSADCLPIEGENLACGTKIKLHLPKELSNISPGFYMAQGNEGFTEEDSKSLIRLYLNLTPQGAINFMGEATTRLNNQNIAFKLKALNKPEEFTRCDAVVLYIPKKEFDTVMSMIRDILPNLIPNMKPNVPVFTKLLVPGLALAEDPPDGMYSFGMSRCYMLSEALVRSFEKHLISNEMKFEEIKKYFAENYIDFKRSYLNPGSNDDYDFTVNIEMNKKSSTSVNSRIKYDVSNYLLVAKEIGSKLVKNAIWDNGRCNWMGITPMESQDMSGNRTSYKALGPDLYLGTSGIALFLSELYKFTNDTSMYKTSIGAIKQALSLAENIPSSTILGMYTGATGVILAAVRIATLFGDNEILNQSLQLLQRVIVSNHSNSEFDLLSGKAGAILALLTIDAMINDKSLVDRAVLLGKNLIEIAEKSKIGYSWGSPNFTNEKNLTGYSHGTAGVAHSLLELYNVTKDSNFLYAVEQAFAYEQYWFNADRGNWPDFRDEPRKRRLNKQQLSYANTWCHGAPGIGLSRIRAYDILKNEQYKSDAAIALRTASKMIELGLVSGSGNYSLCHGLAGNAEVLLEGSQILPEYSELTIYVKEIANFGISTCANMGRSWPCGVGGGETPGLMVGLAGIGYFYLRLYDKTVPSILLFSPEDFKN